MALFDGIPSEVNPISGNTGNQRSKFKRPLGFGWHNTNDTEVGGPVTVGDETPIVKFRVPAGREYSWGFGSAQFEANQGYMDGEILIEDGSGGTESAVGTVILEQRSSTGRNQEMVTEVENKDLPAGNTRDSKEPLPEQDDFDLVTQDSYLVVSFSPDSDEYTDQNSVVVDPQASSLSIPVTEYDLTQQ